MYIYILYVKFPVLLYLELINTLKTVSSDFQTNFDYESCYTRSKCDHDMINSALICYTRDPRFDSQ